MTLIAKSAPHTRVGASAPGRASAAATRAVSPTAKPSRKSVISFMPACALMALTARGESQFHRLMKGRRAPLAHHLAQALTDAGDEMAAQPGGRFIAHIPRRPDQPIGERLRIKRLPLRA